MNFPPLRSYYGTDRVLKALRSGYVTPTDVVPAQTTFYCNVATACKIDLTSVIFAYAAFAADIVDENDGGAKKIEISSYTSPYLGKLLICMYGAAELPDYGMYLKTASCSSFSPTGYL